MNSNAGVRLPGFTGAISLGPSLQTYGSTASHHAGREQIILEACPGPLVRGVGRGFAATEPEALSLALTAAFEDFLKRCPPPCFFDLPFGGPARRARCGSRLGFSLFPIQCVATFTGLCLPERPADPVPAPEPVPVPAVVAIPSPVVVMPPVTVPVPESGVSDTLLTVAKVLGIIVVAIVGTVIFIKLSPFIIAGAGAFFGAAGTALAQAFTAAGTTGLGTQGAFATAAAAAGFTVVVVQEEQDGVPIVEGE